MSKLEVSADIVYPDRNGYIRISRIYPIRQILSGYYPDRENLIRIYPDISG